LKKLNKIRKNEILRGSVGSPLGNSIGRYMPYSNKGEIKNKNYDTHEKYMDSDRRKPKREVSPLNFYSRPIKIKNAPLVKDPA